MPTTTTQTQMPSFPPIDAIGSKALDMMTAVAEANQKLVGQLIELSSIAAADRLRAFGELQTAAVDAARGALTPVNPREAFEEIRQDPFAWYRKSVTSMLDSTQRMFRLAETNLQIVSKSAERLQGTAERTGKEIESAVSTCASRLREIYSTRD